MTDREKFIAEIDRILSLEDTGMGNGDVKAGYENALLDMRRFAASMQEGPVSEDLAVAVEEYLEKHIQGGTARAREIHKKWGRCIAFYFADWQKQKIIKGICNHTKLDQMVDKFEDKYKPEKVLDTEYYKRGIFDTINEIEKEGTSDEN